MGSHLTATGRHLPYGITHCYLLPDTSEYVPTSSASSAVVLIGRHYFLRFSDNVIHMSINIIRRRIDIPRNKKYGARCVGAILNAHAAEIRVFEEHVR